MNMTEEQTEIKEDYAIELLKNKLFEIENIDSENTFAQLPIDNAVAKHENEQQFILDKIVSLKKAIKILRYLNENY